MKKNKKTLDSDLRSWFRFVLSNDKSMKNYSVKKLSALAGVSIRTLHIYDQTGLLKPVFRTEAGYRMYGEKELLRLQQILFYKELDFSLQEICNILDDPDFDLIQALESHKRALYARKQRIDTLLETLDKTIIKLKENKIMNHEELYEGLPKEKAEAYRNEAIEKWGSEKVEHSEKTLKKMGKEGLKALVKESEAIREALASLIHHNPEGAEVQFQIERHYQNIRKFWGTAGSSDAQAEAYAGLGQLYVDDPRYTEVNGQTNPEFALFMSKAMRFFADTRLK